MSKSEPVGYKQPPKFHQFKKGKSGNPMGRPKGSKSLKRAIIDEANKKIEISENGQVKSATKMEILAMAIWAKALKGDSRAMSEVMKYCARFDLEDAGDMEPRPLTEDELHFHLGRFTDALLEKMEEMRAEKESKKSAKQGFEKNEDGHAL